MNGLDIVIQNYFSAIRTAGISEYLYLFTILFYPSIAFVLVSLCVIALIYMTRGIRYVILFCSTMFVGGASVILLKLGIHIGRPADALASGWGSSFPSGHATIATIFFIMLMYIFDTYFSTVGRIIFNTFCIAGILLMAISRVYLGAHWASDVVFGLVFGSAVCAISIGFFRRRRVVI